MKHYPQYHPRGEAATATSAVHLSHLTPIAFLQRSAVVFPGRVAAIEGDRRLTWAELADRARRLAVALQAAGLERGDRVAVLAPNTIELLEAHFGVPWAGAVLVAVNTRLMPQEIAHILNHSGARVLIVDADLVHLIEPIAAELAVERTFVVGAPAALAAESYDAFLAGAGDGEPQWRIESEDDTISINYTSGTTGLPKGVMYTHRGAYLNALAEAVHARLDSSSVYLWTLPMFHCNGWCFPWAVTARGATHICLRKVDPPLIWRLIGDEGVTHFNGAPTVLVMLSTDPAAAPVERPVLVTTAGAPPSPTIIARMQELGFEINHVYGLTETYGPITICDWHPEWEALDAEERARRKSRQGVAMVTADRVRVVDDELRDVPADAATMGEVVMRGNNVMKGYFRDPEATETAFRGGWFHSGDLGVMHPGGYVELRDRAKDIIISGGENVSTIQIEQTLVRHPDVLEVAVVAMPDEKWGERPIAFVTLRADAVLTEPELIAFSRETLPGFKAPAAVEFGDLPKTSTGKVKKYELRERVRHRRAEAT